MENKILIKIVGDIKDLNQKVDAAAKKLDKWSKDSLGGFTAMAESLGKLAIRFTAFTAPITGTGAALFGLMKKTANAGSELQDLHEQTGIVVEELDHLRRTAELSDVTLSELSMQLTFLYRYLNDARNNAGEARDVFKSLGIDTAKPLGQIIRDVAKRFSELKDGEDKLALATKMFGRSGKDILPVLNDLASGTIKASSAFDKEAAEAAAKFNDNIDILKQNIEGLVHKIGNALIPAVNKFFDLFKDNEADRIVDSYKNINTEIANLGIRIAQIQGQGDTSGLEKHLLDLVDKSLDPLKSLNKEIAELEKRISQMDVAFSGSDVSGLENRLATLKAARDKLAARQFAGDQPKKDVPLPFDEKKWLEDQAKFEKELGESLREEAKLLYEARQRELEQRRELQEVREAEINLQLKEIDLAEQEFRISKSDAVRERIRLQRELLAIQEEYLATLDKSLDPASWYAQKNAIDDTRTSLVELNLQLKEQTGTMTEGLKYGLQKYLHDAKTVFEHGVTIAQQSAQAMQDGFSSFFFDVMDRKLKSLSDYVNSFLNSVKKAISDVMGQMAVRGLLSLIPSFAPGPKQTPSPSFNAPVSYAHKGGYIVPRFHIGGLAHDEVPAILQRGEYVVSRKGVDALDKINRGDVSNPGVNVSINVNNQTGKPVDMKSSGVKFDGEKYVIDVILKDLESNGPLRYALANR